MTYGQAFMLTASYAALVVLAIMLGQARAGGRGAFAVWLGVVALTAVLLWARATALAPDQAVSLLPAVFAAVATFAACGVVALRRRRHGPVGRGVTGVAAWLVLLFVWFQLNYLAAR